MGDGESLRPLKQLRDATGKFTKGQAYYVNNAIQKPFRCGNCNHYSNGKCRLVSSSGDPNPGGISPQGACALYNARAPRIQTYQLIWGRGGVDGVAPEVARATAFMFTYAALDEEPPEDLKEKALWNPSDLK